MSLDNPYFGQLVTDTNSNISSNLNDETANTDWGKASIDWATKGIPLAVSSGIVQIANSLDWVGNKALNLVRNEDSQVEYKATPEYSLATGDDSDLKDYYDSHKRGIDFGGFVAGSIIPSALGVKGLRLMQSGTKVGEATNATTGLLSNTAETYWLNRAALAGESSLVPKIAASLSGGVQVGLEATAAQLATFATMNQSSVFEDVNDLGSFTKMMLEPSLIFGGVGALYKYAKLPSSKFLLEGADSTLTANRSSLGEIKNAQGELLSSATKTTVGENLAGIKLGKNNLPKDVPMTQGETEAGAQLGDDLANLYQARNAKRSENLATLPTELRGTKLGTELTTQAKVVSSTAVQKIDNRIMKVIEPMKADAVEGSVVKLKRLLDSSPTSLANQLLTGAKKFTRVNDDVNSYASTLVVDLRTGELGNKGHFRLADTGVVDTLPDSRRFIKVDGQRVSVSKAQGSADKFNAAPQHIANARYAIEDAHFAKLSEPLALPDTISKIREGKLQAQSWDLPTIDAMYSHTNSINVDGTYLVGQDALQWITKNKFDLMKSDMYKTMPVTEVANRLGVAPEIIGTTKTVAKEQIVNGAPATENTLIGIQYAVKDAIPRNLYEVISQTRVETIRRCYRDMNVIISDSILPTNHNLVDFNFNSEFKGIDDYAKFLSSANPEYNTFSSKITHNGTQVAKMLYTQASDRAGRFMDAHFGLRDAVAGGAEAVELASIKSLVTSSKAGKVYLKPNGELYAIMEGDDVGKLIHTIKDPKVNKYLQTVVEEDGLNVARLNKVRVAQGKDRISVTSKKIDEGKQLYFAPPAPNESAFKALVHDGESNVGMVWASTKDELRSKITQVLSTDANYSVYYPEDTDLYYRFLDLYDEQKALRNFSKVDTVLVNKGVMSDLTPTTNIQQFLDGIQVDFMRKERGIMNSTLYLRYGEDLARLKVAEESITGSGTGTEKVFRTLFNLNMPNESWQAFNNTISKAVDSTFGRGVSILKDSFNSIKDGKKTLTQLEAETFAGSLDRNIFGNDALWQMSKRSEWQGSAEVSIRKMNAGMRFFQLGIDVFAGVTNVIGSVILGLPEVMAASKAVGSEVSQFSPLAVMGRSLKEVTPFSTGYKQLLEEAANHGVVNKNMFAHMDLIDSYANVMKANSGIQATAAANSTVSMLEKFMNKLQTPSAYAEQFTQVLAFATAKNIAKSRGLEGQAATEFLTTFVKKVNGNLTAAQRPILFQGVVGQAVGLFQTYNFNYYQQLARYLNVNASSAAMLMALQGTVFGAQSMPTFELMNKAIVAYGTDSNDDFSVRTKQILGSEAADWLTYGVGSNLLGANLYSRGNTNPRQATVIPVTPSEIASLSYYANILKAGYKGFENVTNGGSAGTSLLLALEQSKLSRPITGIAEIAMGQTNSVQGNLDTSLAGEDLMSWATAIRVMGARPMDEAVVREATYKYGQYQAQQEASLADVKDALKTSIMSGNVDVNSYAEKFVKLGGDPKKFRQFYLAAMKAVDVPRAQLMAQKMSDSPWARNYQQITMEHQAPPEQAILASE